MKYILVTLSILFLLIPPTYAEYVNSYYRDDGTYVNGYYRNRSSGILQPQQFPLGVSIGADPRKLETSSQQFQRFGFGVGSLGYGFAALEQGIYQYQQKKLLKEMIKEQKLRNEILQQQLNARKQLEK